MTLAQSLKRVRLLASVAVRYPGVEPGDLPFIKVYEHELQSILQIADAAEQTMSAPTSAPTSVTTTVWPSPSGPVSGMRSV